MKLPSTLASVLSLIGLAMTFSVNAADQAGPYVSVDAGGALTGDVSLKEYPGAGGGSKVEFNPGIRLSLDGGWRFSQWLRAGGQFGVISHQVDGPEVSYGQFPILGNVEFQIPNRWRLIPFFGGGAGVSIATVTFDDDNLAGGDVVDGSAADAVFAWQLYGGLRYKLSETMAVGLVYKYFESESTNWEVDGTATDIRFGRARTHSISASFSMDF
jgi:opacity protein-like surface antigen